MQVNLFKRQLRQGGAIDMVNLRAVASDGCPDTGNLRLIAWKVIQHRPLYCTSHAQHVPNMSAYAGFWTQIIVLAQIVH